MIVEVSEGVEVDFPAEIVVCSDCDGRGSTYLGWISSEQPAFTREDFDREGDDFACDYMEGRYDKTCPTCRGKTTVLEVLEPPEGNSLRELWCLWQEQLQSAAECDAEMAAERRMGA